MLDHIGRVPRSARAIFTDVRNDYGAADERRLWRNLTLLVKQGLVIRHPKTDIEDDDNDRAYSGHTYSRAVEKPRRPRQQKP